MVLDAAIVEFAAYGLYGATTEAIAGRVGITQPYIFRLFRSKKDLFMAAVDRVYGRIIETWDSVLEEAGEDAGTERRMLAMGQAYERLMGSRKELLLLLQGFAASKDPDILRMNRERMAQVHRYVTRVAQPARDSGEQIHEVQEFLAHGMLLTVAAGLDLPEISDTEPWAREFMGTDKPWSEYCPGLEIPP